LLLLLSPRCCCCRRVVVVVAVLLLVAVVVVVVLVVLVLVVVVLVWWGGCAGGVVAGSWWMWLPLWLLFSICLGDAACHVINVGTCYLSLANQSWDGSSTVKHVLAVIAKVECSNPRNDICFLHQFKLN
jgi:hypothetical protein